ncbi:MAG: hypothetical protein IPG42_11485 [Betaproteobacteria bacterium]|nr:hypothetical protein [Betaproteobacteria bacterium]
MITRQLKVAVATLGLLAIAGAASANEVVWSKAPLTMKWPHDSACKVIVNAIEQDNPGQPIGSVTPMAAMTSAKHSRLAFASCAKISKVFRVLSI